ncbi:hypothetical protein Hanom_Chr06g00480161 [Helianthus anomalus]
MVFFKHTNLTFFKLEVSYSSNWITNFIESLKVRVLHFGPPKRLNVYSVTSIFSSLYFIH